MDEHGIGEDALERDWLRLFEIEEVATRVNGLRADALCFKCKCSHGCKWKVADPEVFGFQFFTTRPTEDALRGQRVVHEVLEQIDAVHTLVRANEHVTELARSSGDVARVNAEGRVPALIGVGGVVALEESPALLRMYRELGARYISLEDSDLERADELEHAIQTANQLGLLVHAAGVSADGVRRIADLSASPIAASSPAASGRTPISDEVMQAVAAAGGIVLVDASMVGDDERLADALVEAIKVAGIDHVGLATEGGSDDGRVALYPALRRTLSDRDLDEGDLEKILGGNLCRVLQAAEDAAGV